MLTVMIMRWVTVRSPMARGMSCQAQTVKCVDWKDNIGDMEIEGFETYVNYQQGQFETGITYSSAESDLTAFEQYSELDGARLDRQQGDTICLHYVSGFGLF